MLKLAIGMMFPAGSLRINFIIREQDYILLKIAFPMFHEDDG
jgi:hypothetical protein